MSKEKQIEEMAKDLCQSSFCTVEEWGACSERSVRNCARCKIVAIELHKLGYRKQSENVVDLPCKIGQKVYTNIAMQGWYFRNNDKPYSAEIVFIGLNNSEEMGGGFFNIAYENRGYMMNFNFSDIGKTVFLTKEEAEAKMKEGAE